MTRETEDYIFTTSEDLSKLAGSSYVMGLSVRTLHVAEIRGKLLTLFGEPAYESVDAENAYNYVIEATGKASEETVFLSCYQGSTGASIGGDPLQKGVKEAANALSHLIKNATPTDFKRKICYMDTLSNIEYGCVNGVPFVEESHMSYEELLKEFPEFAPD